ncbi:MAG: hypothetical protein CM1200mP2_56600 [Planctomycetaceae bacterium]|nr:MAG: hypothetical protein CM1200mP2_56600 [Planctomycetaceae bacterium]
MDSRLNWRWCSATDSEHPEPILSAWVRRLCQRAPELIGRTRLIFPAAPLSLDEVGMPGGRAWWHLDLEALNNAMGARGIPRPERVDSRWPG